METILFYGGLAAMAVSLLLLLILVPVFRGQRKHLLKQLDE